MRLIVSVIYTEQLFNWGVFWRFEKSWTANDYVDKALSNEQEQNFSP